MQEPINNQSMLKVGTILRGIYRIDSNLSSGGFGNTYVATNIEFDERVAIKEFFMKGVTQRDDNQTTVSVSNAENQDSFLEQREKFKKEARRLRQLNNPHIVKVHDLFEENGTAYYVMDYVDGENLSDRLKRTGKPMSEKKVNEILPQILDALKSVHDTGIWHLDLKPANIMVDKSGQVKLIDFGASKQLNAQKGGATTSTAISYTNGYAPREQMEQNYDKFGPWTDLYALGATLYSLLTNKRPPLPSDIDDDMSEDKHMALSIPANVSDAMRQHILWLMKTNRLQRPQQIDEFLPVLEKDKKKTRATTKKKEATEKAEKPVPQSVKPVDNNSEETLIAPQTDKQEKRQAQEETSQDVDLSYIDDLEETWKDKLWSYLSDLKSVAIILGLFCIPSLFGIIKRCTERASIDVQKEYAKLFEASRNPNISNETSERMFTQLQTLAEREYGPAIFLLGSLICDKDSAQAVELFNRSFPILSKEAIDGDMYAQYALGCCYYSAVGVSQDYNNAYLWFKKSADQGFPEAMQSLAICYLTGNGVQVDYDKGLDWQLKAAESNIPSILCSTGEIYDLYIDDSTKAFFYYKKAADLGDTTALIYVASCYANGNVVTQDFSKAFDYYYKASEKGVPLGYLEVGILYYLADRIDIKIEKDIQKAIDYLETSLKYTDDIEAHFWLGRCYLENKDEYKAFQHWKIAAEANNRDAQYELYFCYCHGVGVEKNQELAQMWRRRAIENGYQEE